MLHDSVAVVRTRPQAILLAMITMRKSTHGFLFVSHMSKEGFKQSTTLMGYVHSTT